MTGLPTAFSPSALVARNFRELVAGPRAWRGPVLYALALAAVTIYGPPVPGCFGGSQLHGPALAWGLVLLQTLILPCIAPLFGMRAMAHEQDRPTLNVLMRSRSARATILLSKLAAGVLGCLHLLSASLPQAGLAYLTGTLDLAEIAGIYATGTLVAIAFASLGIAAATVVRTPAAATLVAIVAGLAPAATLATAVFVAGRTPALVALAAGMSPFSGLYLHVGLDSVLGPLGPLWLAHYGALLGMATVALAFAFWRLGKAARA
jgi:ABC-type transport system involved in multi-copper enzyme maturation permease subunit